MGWKRPIEAGKPGTDERLARRFSMLLEVGQTESHAITTACIGFTEGVLDCSRVGVFPWRTRRVDPKMSYQP